MLKVYFSLLAENWWVVLCNKVSGEVERFVAGPFVGGELVAQAWADEHQGSYT